MSKKLFLIIEIVEFMEARIDRNGAILLAENFVCDSHADRPFRIVTHAHSDHMLGLEKSLDRCDFVVATSATKDLIEILKGDRIAFDKIHAVEYRTPLKYGDENITLFPAGHIVGSAQVLVENSLGRRIVYTGDFRLNGAEIIQSDVLVIEATYGNPNHVRAFKESVEPALVDLVERSLNEGPVFIFGYHGKLQETLGILRRAGINIPALMPEKVYRIAEICENHGINLGEFYPSRSEEARKIIRSGEPYIGLYHMKSRGYMGKDATRIYLSGWEFLLPIRKLSNRDYAVALSDHSDFEQLLEYVEKSDPELVITDNYRIGDAQALAYEITKRLRIQAIAMPH